jgi:hypothetical protein
LKKRDKAFEKLKQARRRETAAEVTRLTKAHNKYKKKADSIYNILLRRRLKYEIQKFYDTIYTKEVDQQLNGIKPTNTVKSPMYKLPERQLVAELFLKVAKVESREELY